MDITPNQLVSIAAGLIPFLEHNDANRALMGSNMQRQAVPLFFSDSPLIGTGMEQVFSKDSSVCTFSSKACRISYVDSSKIITETLSKSPFGLVNYHIDIYRIKKYKRSNQNTCINQKPTITYNDSIRNGQNIITSSSIQQGELALGKNVLVAFMSWHGYNFEDSILINKKLIESELFTSIHIEEYELICRDTKLGPEEITKDIPNLNASILQKLNESGIVNVGAMVNTGDILVGKITPKGEVQLSPEEKLIKAIFGDKAGDIQDTSLRWPAHYSGIVISTKLFKVQSKKKNIFFKDKNTHMEKSVVLNKNIAIKTAVKSCFNTLYNATKNRIIGQDFITANICIKKNSVLKKEQLRLIKWTDYKKIKFKNNETNITISKIIKTVEFKCKSIYYDFYTFVLNNQKSEELPHGFINLVKICVAIKRALQSGDKMSGRHGNKGIISKILPNEDMPFLVNGTSIDVVLNPLGVPSRMNVGQILETYLGWAMYNTGQFLYNLFTEKKYNQIKLFLKHVIPKNPFNRINMIKNEKKMTFFDFKKQIVSVYKGVKVSTPVFDGVSEKDIIKLLKLTDENFKGQITLFDGRSGACFNQDITVGIMYILKLHHLVDEKLHARSVGPYSLVTQQPLGGKSQCGGQRLGEMEVWALEGYGAAYALQEFLTVKSDDVNGRTKMYESIIKGEHTLESSVPESFNVLMKELQSLGLDIQLFEDISYSKSYK